MSVWTVETAAELYAMFDLPVRQNGTLDRAKMDDLHLGTVAAIVEAMKNSRLQR